MKIRELFEETNPNEMSDDEVVDIIKRDCKPFLQNKVDGFLFRGIKKQKDNVLKLSVRGDRRPQSTPLDFHNAIDDWFEKEFGFKARSETVFTSGDYRTASGYGIVYAIFPIGDFEFVWSPKVRDLFFALHANVDANIPGLPGEMAKWKYQHTDLKTAIESNHEVMIKCKEYYAVRMDTKDKVYSWMGKIL